MHTLTNKSGLLEFFRANVADGASDPAPVQAWPAPEKKADVLVLKKPSLLPADVFAQSANSSGAFSGAPFPSPVRDNAFEVPHPAVVPGASAAWAPPARKSPPTVMGDGSGVRSEVEFSRPPRFTEKLSLRHGQYCRPC